MATETTYNVIKVESLREISSAAGNDDTGRIQISHIHHSAGGNGKGGTAGAGISDQIARNGQRGLTDFDLISHLHIQQAGEP